MHRTSTQHPLIAAMKLTCATLSLVCVVGWGCDSDEHEETIEPICPISSTDAPYHIQKPAPGTIVYVGDSLEISVKRNGDFISPNLVFSLLLADGRTELPLRSRSEPMPNEQLKVKVYIAPSYPVGDFGTDFISPVTDSARIKVTSYNGGTGITRTAKSSCYIAIRNR